MAFHVALREGGRVMLHMIQSNLGAECDVCEKQWCYFNSRLLSSLSPSDNPSLMQPTVEYDLVLLEIDHKLWIVVCLQ